MSYTSEEVEAYFKRNLVNDNSDQGFMLWNLVWKQNVDTVFSSEDVIRDGTTNVFAPQSCTVFKPVLSDLLQSKKVFVRDEYVTGIDDALYFYEAGRSRSDEDPDLQDTSITSLNVMVERFKAKASEGTSTLGRTTTWLSFLLLIRLLAGLPTLYHTKAKFATLFTKTGVHIFKADAPVNVGLLPENTWLLVDGNEGLKNSIPYDYGQSDLFIVYAPSARSRNFAWASKTVPFRLFYMKPFSLTELVIGRQFQRPTTTEQQLEGYYTKFVPSARIAYGEAWRQNQYQCKLSGILSQLLCSGFVEMLRAIGKDSSLHGEISHQFFLVRPTSRSRLDFEIVIPTRYLYDSITQVYVLTPRFEASIYQLFLEAPTMRANAVYAFESLVDHAFLKGGEWPIRPMVKHPRNDQNTHYWSPPTAALIHYLTLSGIHVHVSPQHSDAAANPLTRCEYNDTQTPQLASGVYHKPLSDRQLMFDAFIYDSVSLTVTIFQITFGHQQKVRAKGFDWLIANFPAIRKFRYVLVRPAIDSVDADLPVPNEVLDKISDLPGSLEMCQLQMSFD